MVLDGQTHAVKHKAVKQLCICGQILELLSGHKQPGDAVIGKLFGFFAVEIVKIDLLLQAAHLLPNRIIEIRDSGNVAESNR